MFSNQIREHNGTFYKMQTLDRIYNSKKILDLKIDMMQL